MTARRWLTIPLALLLAASVCWGLLFWRAVTVTSDPGWAQDTAGDLGLYELLHDEALPAALDLLLDEQEDRLPDNLQAIELPTDEASREAALRFAREALPPELVRDRIERWLGAVVPYAFHRTDEFTLRTGLHEPIELAFGHAPGEPSAAERVWRELDMGRLVIDGAIEQAAAEAGVPAAVIRDTLSAGQRTEAAAWFTRQLFGALDEIRPWVLGERDDFRIEISFAGFPELTSLLAPILARSPQELAAAGFTLDSTTLLNDLAGSDSTLAQDIEQRREWFRTDWSYTQADLRADIADASDDPGAALDSLDTLRRIGGAWRAARWAVPVWCLLLGAALAWLAGGRLPARLLWALVPALVGATALLLPAAAGGFILDAPGVGERLGETTADWDPQFDPLARELERVALGATARLLRSVAWLALLWTALLALATGGTMLWWRREARAAGR